MDRRSILRAALGIASIPANVSVKTAAAALGVDTALAGGSLDNTPTTQSGDCSPSVPKYWSHIYRLRRKNELMERGVKYMPPHIAGKRSWSHVYKASVFAHEQMILAEYMDRMERDEGFAEKVFASLGITVTD